MRGSFRDWCVFLQAGEPVAWVTVLPDPTGHEFRDLAQSVDIYRSDVRLTTVAGRPALDLEEHGIVVSSGGDMWSFTVHHPADRSSVEPHDREREFALEVFRAVAAS